jgi:hypothetical protein
MPGFCGISWESLWITGARLWKTFGQKKVIEPNFFCCESRRVPA